ncbi:MAG: MoaD/ThiS family protein [Anaerolineae bacterium]|jgi:molybdopterin synthase sulfur carrier subunit
MIVKVFSTLRPLVGARELDFEVEDGDTVRDVLETLIARYPPLGERVLDDDGHVHDSIHVLVNGRSISFLDGLETVVGDGDRLALFPAVGGG